MRTETLDIEIFGSRLRLICENPVGSALLRSALSDYLVDEPAEPGFVLRDAERKGGLHILMDRSGFVLGRTRTVEECVAVLGSHLGVLAPPPSGTIRMHMRALVGDDFQAVLAGFPLFISPPLVERRLERASHRVIDRLAVDITPDGVLEMSPSPWPALANLHTVAGHHAAPVQGVRVAATLLPQNGAGSLSLSNVIAFLASAAAPGATMLDRIAVAEKLARDKVIQVQFDDHSDCYAALLR